MLLADNHIFHTCGIGRSFSFPCQQNHHVKPKDGPPSTADGGRNNAVDFKGQKLTNGTHGSVSDTDARLCRKGKSITETELLQAVAESFVSMA